MLDEMLKEQVAQIHVSISANTERCISIMEKKLGGQELMQTCINAHGKLLANF